MIKKQFNKIIALVCVLIIYSCDNFSSTTKVTSPRVVQSYSNNVDRTFSEKDEITVFENIKFGISKDQYRKIMKNESSRLGVYDFHFEPHFDYKGKLMELWITSIHSKRYGDNYDKKYLIDLITNRYGIPDSVNHEYYPRVIIDNYPTTVELSLPASTYFWYIGDKHITITEAFVRDQDLRTDEGGFPTVLAYPRMIIQSESLFNKHIVQEVLKDNLREDSKKF